jgi:hypothetical protein
MLNDETSKRQLIQRVSKGLKGFLEFLVLLVF